MYLGTYNELIRVSETWTQIEVSVCINRYICRANNNILLLSWQMFSPLVGVGQSFPCFHPPSLPILCILLHNCSSYVLHYCISPSLQWPASLHSIFSSNNLSQLPHLFLQHVWTNSFCSLKCSSKSFTPTLDTIYNPCTLSFYVTPQIIVSILLCIVDTKTYWTLIEFRQRELWCNRYCVTYIRYICTHFWLRYLYTAIIHCVS